MTTFSPRKVSRPYKKVLLHFSGHALRFAPRTENFKTCCTALFASPQEIAAQKVSFR